MNSGSCGRLLYTLYINGSSSGRQGPPRTRRRLSILYRPPQLCSGHACMCATLVVLLLSCLSCIACDVSLASTVTCIVKLQKITIRASGLLLPSWRAYSESLQSVCPFSASCANVHIRPIRSHESELHNRGLNSYQQ